MFLPSAILHFDLFLPGVYYLPASKLTFHKIHVMCAFMLRSKWQIKNFNHSLSRTVLLRTFNALTRRRDSHRKYVCRGRKPCLVLMFFLCYLAPSTDTDVTGIVAQEP